MFAISNQSSFSSILKKFLGFLSTKNRLFFLNQIIDSFLNFVSSNKGELKAKLISSKELTSAELVKIQSELSNDFKSPIKIDYKHPQNTTLILSERKGVYINHNLKESQYFSTKKSYIKIFFKLLKSNEFAEKPRSEENFIKINDRFVLGDSIYQITILYENNPIKLRKIMVLEDNQNLEISFFDHNNLEFFDKKLIT